ncbi:MAG: hypothetical protein LBF80_00910 [Spirochaetaceae bacterium]|jgi:hypothetical protein|nr:hypothetical protein [Spirochaetaceae bacterium]
MKQKRILFLASALLLSFTETLFAQGSNRGTASTDQRRLKITLDGKQVITATLANSPLVDEFITKLPLTLNMTDYLQREKHGGLSFSLSQRNLTNVQKEYAIGDIIYYPPGPTFAMYYAHDGRVISAGMEVLARLDAEGIRTLATFPANVQVMVELASNLSN